jgi:hypothetical protein
MSTQNNIQINIILIHYHYLGHPRIQPTRESFLNNHIAKTFPK